MGIATTEDADVAIVGGGVAGMALATLLARSGVGVLVLERQETYRDRVRGEFLATWGVAEAQRLGLCGVLEGAGGFPIGRAIPYDEVEDPAWAEANARTLDKVLPGVPGHFAAGHPAFCAALACAAEAAGALVLRGVSDTLVEAGARPALSFVHAGRRHLIRPRLVIGADGRTSAVRAQTRIPLERAAPTHLISGMLVDDVEGWPQDAMSIGTEGDVMFFVFPQGGQRVRLYTCTALDQRDRWAGPEGPCRFVAAFRSLTCMPARHAAALGGGTPAGPCATLDGDDTWTDRPFADGVVLVGDAAGYNDPIQGQGLAIALRDARLVAEVLLGGDDWSPGAFECYAEERLERMRRLRFTAALSAALATTFGPEGAARRKQLRARQRSGEEPRLAMAGAAGGLGPENVPDWAFTDEFRAEVLG